MDLSVDTLITVSCQDPSIGALHYVSDGSLGDFVSGLDLFLLYILESILIRVVCSGALDFDYLVFNLF